MDRGVVLLVSGASTALHVPFILHSFPVISFLIYGNGAEAWPRNRVQQMVIDKLIAKQPHDIWHGNLPQNDRERERQRERERKRKRKNEQTNERKKERKKRASEFDAKWYGSCWKQGTTGWISLIGFARSVSVQNSICVVYAKFSELSCMVPGCRFWGGPIALQCFVRISDKRLLQY